MNFTVALIGNTSKFRLRELNYTTSNRTGMSGDLRRISGGFIAAALLAISPISVLHAADPNDVDDFLATGSCPGCDLSGAFLDSADGEYGDMWNANLSDSSLYRVDFNHADLSGADFTGAKLVQAQLNGADLTNASLIGADLTDAAMAQSLTVGAVSDASTICPNGLAGPCNFEESNQ